MRIALYGDHSYYHVGCKAVWDYLVSLVEDRGFDLAKDYRDCDVLIINGEGTMHNRCGGAEKLRLIKRATDIGKKVYFINSVWHRVSCKEKELIKLCEKVFVREIISYDEIKSVRPDAQISIDLSYFSPIIKPVYKKKGACIGSFYFEHPSWMNDSPLTKGYRNISIYKFKTWQEYINALSGSRLLVTGLHHETIAAMKLRIPFAAIRGNTDKVLGIVQMSGADIPVAETDDELLYNIDNLPPQEEYDKLFDFIEVQEPFTLRSLGL